MMTAMIRGELIKTVSTRTLLGYTVTGVTLAIANVVIVTEFSGDLHTVSDKQEAIAGLPIIVLLFGLVGATGEYRHRTAASAVLAAGRDRALLLLARAGAYALTGLAIGALMVAVALLVGLPLLGAHPGPGLGSHDVALVAGGSLIAAAASAIMGLAVGAIVRNQVAGVVGVLILAFVVSPLIAVIDETAVEVTPFGAAFALAGDPQAGSLSWGGDALLLLAWTVPLLIAALVTERRRDLT
jgi:ABC-2 type transport system permease protein